MKYSIYAICVLATIIMGISAMQYAGEVVDTYNSRTSMIMDMMEEINGMD
jgi:hypothetical protein